MFCRKADASGRVFAVDDDEIEPPVGPEARQPRGHGRPARPAHHIPKEQKSHAEGLGGGPAEGKRRLAQRVIRPDRARQDQAGTMMPVSVTIRSSGWSVGSVGTRSTSCAA